MNNNFFQGFNKTHSYFEGWYFLARKGDHMLALIPGMNIDSHGEKSAFIQVISNNGSHYIPFAYSEFFADAKKLYIRIGKTVFSEEGIEIDITAPDLTLKGSLSFGQFTPIQYSIMGPFSVLKFMECYHGIESLHHNVSGEVLINDRTLNFNNGTGYIEKDWGSSFPSSYIWLQCNDFTTEKCCIIASIAEIPLGRLRFKGCIAVFYIDNKEYRFATYNGTKILCANRNKIILKKGKLTLEITVFNNTPHTLFAPDKGHMSRSIHENTGCKGLFKLTEGNKTLYSFSSENTIFEFVE